MRAIIPCIPCIPCIALVLAGVLPASAQSTTGYGQTEASLDYTRGARIVCARGGCREVAPGVTSRAVGRNFPCPGRRPMC